MSIEFSPLSRRSSAPQGTTLAQQLGNAFIGFGVLVAVAACASALAYLVGRFWLNAEFEQSRLAVRSENAAATAMLDEEAGLRGYALARDVRFLEPYMQGEVQLARAHEALTASVGSVPELATAMLDTRLAEEKWQGQWAIRAADTSAEAVSPSMIEGKALFDTYRRYEIVFANALAERSETLAARSRRVGAARVALDLLVFTAILILAMRQHRALHEEIVAPVAALLAHIRRIRDGHLESSPAHRGPRELAELAEGLDDMVLALAEARAAAASRDDALRHHSIQLRQILDASREFSESLNLAYVVRAVRESTAAVGGYESVTVWLMDDDRKRLVNSDESPADAALNTPIEIRQGLAGRAAKSGRVMFEGTDDKVRFSDGSVVPVRGIAIPLIVGARVVGVLEARKAEASVATTQVVEILEMLATHAATAIESARLHEVIEERSQMDALTRLFNRRRLEEDLDAEFKRCARYGRPMAFVMLDVDHFKEFNDSHGHPQADIALQEIANVILGSVRTTDTAYRYGGEEFCILLRETSAGDAMLFAERVRQRVELRFLSGPTLGITASFGVAEFASDTPTPRALVEAADSAMYESKRGGRNRVTLAASARPVPSGGITGSRPS